MKALEIKTSILFNPFTPTTGVPKCLRKICAFWNSTTLIDLGILIIYNHTSNMYLAYVPNAAADSWSHKLSKYTVVPAVRVSQHLGPSNSTRSAGITA